VIEVIFLICDRGSHLIWSSDGGVVWYGQALDIAVDCVARSASGEALDEAVKFGRVSW